MNVFAAFIGFFELLIILAIVFVMVVVPLGILIAVMYAVSRRSQNNE